MASAIEEIIDEIEEYLDECKPSAFSSTKIIVNRGEIDGLINTLKSKIPTEVAKYQKVLNNRDAIIKDAERRAKEIISAAEIQTSELVSEHQIMQQAYAQANEVVMIATKDAQATLDAATKDANEIRRSAIEYTDELLANTQEILSKSIDTTRAKQNQFLDVMQGYLDTVVSNRMQLNPNPVIDDTAPIAIEPEPSKEAGEDKKTEDTIINTIDKEGQKETEQVENLLEGVIDIPEQFFKKD